MKKVFAGILSCALLVTLAACGSANPTPSGEPTEPPTSEQPSEGSSTASNAPESMPDTTPESTPEPVPGANALVVYFSWSGNTETIANEVASQTGADIFKLEPTTPYSNDYNTVLDEAQAEQRADARPEVMGGIENFDSYDVISLRQNHRALCLQRRQRLFGCAQRDRKRGAGRKPHRWPFPFQRSFQRPRRRCNGLACRHRPCRIKERL